MSINRQYIWGSESNQRAVRDVLRSAKTRHQRVALFGDSQETSPGGRGTQYLNHLNYQLLQSLSNGVTSESMIQNVISETGHWLGRSGKLTDSASNALDSNEIVPGMGLFDSGSSTIKLRDVGQLVTNNGSGFIHVLDYNGSNITSESSVPNQSFIDNTATYNYDAFVVQASGAPDLAYRFHGRSTGAPGYFVASTVQTIGGTDGTGGVVKITIPDVSIPDPSSTPYLNMILGSSTATAVTIIGGRFVSQTDVGGINVQGFAIGGYQTDDLLDNHANAGPMLNAFGPYSMLMFQYGANDVYSGNKSVSEIVTDLEANIDAVRGTNWLNQPNIPVVLITEAPRINGTDAQDAVADGLQEALRDLAYTKHNVVTVDARAYVEQNGSKVWTRQSEEASAFYLDDDVHYTAQGGVVYAQAVAAILSELKNKNLADPIPHLSRSSINALATPIYLGQRR